jgi:hypothetical protein
VTHVGQEFAAGARRKFGRCLGGDQRFFRSLALGDVGREGNEMASPILR